jgi:phytoene synthase
MTAAPEQIIRQGSRTFWLASLFLPPPNRAKAYTLYEWCRRCDDLIDEATSASELEEQISSIDRAPFPPFVNPAHARELLEGFRMDVQGTTYKTFSELELYCFRVAGVVGLMMCPLIGADPEHGPAPAQALGKAMQLTNIARDVQADAKLGRLYLPSELWKLKGDSSSFDTSGEVPSAAQLAEKPELARPVVLRLLQTADLWYQEGLRGLRYLPLRSAIAIAVAGLAYQKIGHVLLKKAKRDPVLAFRNRTVVPLISKLLIILKACWMVACSRGPQKTGHHRGVGRSDGSN